jgi:hypothetical protein
MKSTAIIVQHGICVGMRKSLKFLTAQFNDSIAVEEANVKSAQNDERYDDCAEGSTSEAKGRLSFAKELQDHLDIAVKELMKEQNYLSTLKKEYEEFHSKEGLEAVLLRIHESGIDRSQRYEKENKENKAESKALSDIAMILTGRKFNLLLKEYKFNSEYMTEQQKSEIRPFLRKCRELENKKTRVQCNPIRRLNETQIFAGLSKSHKNLIIEIANDFNNYFSDVFPKDDLKMNNFLNIIQSNLKKL